MPRPWVWMRWRLMRSCRRGLGCHGCIVLVSKAMTRAYKRNPTALARFRPQLMNSSLLPSPPLLYFVRLCPPPELLCVGGGERDNNINPSFFAEFTLDHEKGRRRSMAQKMERYRLSLSSFVPR